MEASNDLATGWLLLFLYVGVALAVSFLCSILEATLLSIRIVELTERKQRGDRKAAKLLYLKQDAIDRSISAILTLNTVAHTVGSVLAGAQAVIVLGEQWTGAFSAVLTLLVLFFTEIIPKTLGTVYASQLVGFVATTLTVMLWAMKWPLSVLHYLTSFISRKERVSMSRGELAAMVTMATEEGALQARESKMVSNVLRLQEILVADVMTPRTMIAMLPVDAKVSSLLTVDAVKVYSRIPLFEKTPDHIVGYIVQRDVLARAAESGNLDLPLAKYSRKALYLPENTSVNQALHRLLESREHIALVADEYGGIEGLITLEDLVETLLGVEILDETDKVADLRAEAIRLRDRRLQAMREWRQGKPNIDRPDIDNPIADKPKVDKPNVDAQG